MTNKKEREPLFITQAKNNSSTFHEFDDQDLESWKIILLKGIINGVFLFIITLLSILFLNYLKLGWYLNVIDIILAFEVMALFFLSFTSIWFGPSPSIAYFKSRIIGRKIQVQTTSHSLRLGTRRFISAIVILLLIP